MRPLYLIALGLFFLPATGAAQVLGVIGSSTAAGGGATTFDSSWVARTALYYKNKGQLTQFYDIAWSGSTTWNGMPSSFVFPSGVTITPQDTPQRRDNETRLIQLGSDVVVVAYPNNDIVNGFSLTQFMANLHVIYDSVVKAGKTCYICSTQPRDDIPSGTRQILLQGKDSILTEFPGRSLDFWTPVTDPSTLGILSQYSAGDKIHLNNAGHAVLAQVAENASIMMPGPLALTLTDFNGRWSGQGVLLQWSATDDVANSPLLFDVQRSSDGSHFTSVYQTAARSTAAASWSWTDAHCPAGRNFYRLGWTEDAHLNYSRIITVDRPGGNLSIGKLYLSGRSVLVTEVGLPAAGTAFVTVMDLNGRLILRRDYAQLSATGTLSIPLPALAGGEYVLKINTSDGQQTAKPFVIF
ncbi:MAG TPA: hypothetical protein VHE54_14735 [Puia sp.]|nr:hypothetical protein [Puia sp.]